jgi:hypothetical protein
MLSLIPVLSACSYAFADQPECLDRVIPVSISDSNGVPAVSMSVANLQGSYRKKPVFVKTIQLEERPPRIILLVDTSGSMGLRAEAAIDAAEGVMSHLPANVEVGLAFFAGNTIPVELPTSDRTTLLLQLQALRRSRSSYRGRTAIRSALVASARMFGTPALGDSISLISDGGENQSKSSPSDVEMALGNSAIRVFALIFQSILGDPRGRDELTGGLYVQDVAESTGGTVVIIPSQTFPVSTSISFIDKNGKATQLALDLDRQLNRFLSFYRAEITLPERVKKPESWKLELAGGSKSNSGKLELSYPRVLLPCH